MKPPARVAIVEANADLADAMAAVLDSDESLRVTAVSHAVEELTARTTAAPFELVLLNVRSSADYGQQIVEAIGHLQNSAGHVPLLVATCTACAPRDAVALINAGATGVFLKGQDTDALLYLIATCLGGGVDVSLPPGDAAIVRRDLASARPQRP